MRRLYLFVLVVALIFVFVSTQSEASLVSTFDTGDEGWSISGGGSNFAWVASGGNPGGYVIGDDTGPGPAWFFMSPLSWGGDWTPYIGGTIEFDLTIINAERDRYFSSFDIMVGNRDTGELLAWTADIFPPTGSWAHYEVPIVSQSFTPYGGTTFQDVMQNVHALYIRGEYTSGADVAGLDNVSVNPVPEPATVLLLGTSLAGLVGFRKKFKK